MAQSQELEAASRSSETNLAENGGGRPASVQPRSRIRVQEGTGQNYLARTHGHGYVTDKPRMMMILDTCLRSAVLLRVEFHAEVAGGGANSCQVGKYYIFLWVIRMCSTACLYPVIAF